MRVAVLGDIGQSVYHVGDEAMAHAAVDALGERGITDLVLLTRNVAETRRDFRTAAVSTVAFPWPPHERQLYLELVLRAVDGDSTALPPGDPALELIDTLRGCDAVLIAGGGNMNSLYGWLLYERVAVTAIARGAGKPVVISGQTLGPALVDTDRDVTAGMLRSVQLIGAREELSLELAEDLLRDENLLPNIPEKRNVARCLDDASFWATAGAPDAGVGEADTGVEDPYVAVTFSDNTGVVDRGAYVQAVAELLDHVVDLTGHRVVFLPHMSTPGTGDGDEAMHAAIAGAMSSRRTERLPIGSARRTAGLTARAELVITSRYHPVVFAADGGVPAVALSVDGYSDVRLRGALQNWGVDALALPLPALLDGGVSAALDEVWERRTELRDHLRAVRAQRLAEHARWWDAVVHVLSGGKPTTDSLGPVPRFTPYGSWARAAALAAQLFLPLTAEVAALRAANEHLDGKLASARRDTEAARGELRDWFGSRSFRLVKILATARTRLTRGKDNA